MNPTQFFLFAQAHYRRFARFVEFAGTADPEMDMDDFWRALDEENKKKAPKPNADGPLSKRAQKRVRAGIVNNVCLFGL